jgi:hypothetical protein
MIEISIFLKTMTFLEHIGNFARTSGPNFARTFLIDSPGHPLEFALTFGSYTQILIERDPFWRFPWRGSIPG